MILLFCENLSSSTNPTNRPKYNILLLYLTLFTLVRLKFRIFGKKTTMDTEPKITDVMDDMMEYVIKLCWKITKLRVDFVCCTFHSFQYAVYIVF